MDIDFKGDGIYIETMLIETFKGIEVTIRPTERFKLLLDYLEKQQREYNKFTQDTDT